MYMDIMAVRRKVMQYRPIENLPAGYTKIDYLSNPNGGYINTGNPLYKGCKITIQFYSSETTGNVALYGWRWSGDYTGTSQLYINYNSNYQGSPAWVIIVGIGVNNIESIGTRHCFDLNVKNTLIIDTDNNVILLNNEQVSFNYNPAKPFNTSGSSVYNPTLFVFNNKGTMPQSSVSTTMRLYKYKVEQDGQLLLNYIPCLNPDQEYGVFDTVTNTFIGSSNSNKFTGGND